MGSDIQPGDVVQCVRDSDDGPDWLHVAWEPKIGSYYGVVAIFDCYDGALILELAEDPEKLGPDYGWQIELFRKVRPADPEFVSLIKRIKIGQPA